MPSPNWERIDLERVAPEAEEAEGKATEILKAAKARLRNFSEQFQKKFTPLSRNQFLP